MTGFLSGGIEHLFDDYLLSSDSDDVVNEAAAYHNQAADSGEHGGSECTTVRTSGEDAIHVRALEEMMSGSGESAFHHSSEPLDGLDFFLHSSVLDFPTAFVEAAVSAPVCKAGYQTAVRNDQENIAVSSYQPKLDPAQASVKAVAAAVAIPHRSASTLIYGGYTGRSLNEIRERELDRRARVERYRQKRRDRAFSKKIRYEVRKINAEQRPRYKGRFISQEELQALKKGGAPL